MLSNIPLVSVVITTFNRREMLARAIDSVAKQTYRNVEIVVSDDCSEYDIETLIEQKRAETDFVIKLRVNEKNSGACYTRNQGIKLASGEFVAGLDDDDEFTIDRISELLKKYDDKFSFITGNTIEKNKKGSRSIFTKFKNKIVTLNDYLWGNCIGTQVFVKRERLLALNGFDETLTSAQDADMWLRLIKKYGPALRLKKDLYILHTEHDFPRISTGKNKIKGLDDYFEKHQKLMTQSQIKYKLNKLKYWRGNRKNKLWFIEVIDASVIVFLIKKLCRIL